MVDVSFNIVTKVSLEESRSLDIELTAISPARGKVSAYGGRRGGSDGREDMATISERSHGKGCHSIALFDLIRLIEYHTLLSKIINLEITSYKCLSR